MKEMKFNWLWIEAIVGIVTIAYLVPPVLSKAIGLVPHGYYYRLPEMAVVFAISSLFYWLLDHFKKRKEMFKNQAYKKWEEGKTPFDDPRFRLSSQESDNEPNKITFMALGDYGLVPTDRTVIVSSCKRRRSWDES